MELFLNVARLLGGNFGGGGGRSDKVERDLGMCRFPHKVVRQADDCRGQIVTLKLIHKN